MFEASKEQINEWKSKHKNVFRLKVGDKACYLKTPTRQTLSYAAVASKENPLKFNEVLLKDCWLGGDEEIRTDDMLFVSACQKLDGLIELKQSELEKL